MLGQDYESFASPSSIICKIGDNVEFPFGGIIRVKFLDDVTIAVIDKNNKIYIQNVIDQQCLTTYVPRDTLLITNRRKRQSIDESVTVVDYQASDLCKLSGNELCVTDSTSHDLKIINTGFKMGVLRIIGGKGTTVNHFDHPSSVAKLQLVPTVLYLVTTEIRNQRMKIIDCDSGNCIISTTTGKGEDIGYFHNPVSVTCHLPIKFRNNPSDIFLSCNPAWYLGCCDITTLKDRLGTQPSPGKMFMCQRPGDITSYDFIYMIDNVKWHQDVIRKHADGRVFLASTAGTEASVSSIWEMIKKWKCIKGLDPRPFAYIAVADQENCRVQIFKFYWTVSTIFQPSIDVIDFIGGRTMKYTKLITPTSVSYSSSGELVICDSGTRKLTVFSRYMSILKELKVDYTTPYNHLSQIQPEPDCVPTSACYASDGKLAIGYKRGGLIVYAPYKSYFVGDFDVLQMKLFLHILSYVHYEDAEQLRNSCTRFHDITRDLRKQWMLLPMRGLEYYTFASYNFIKWCRLIDGEGVAVPVLHDIHGKEVCEKNIECVRGRGCGNRYCLKSHLPPVLDAYLKDLDNLGVFLELKALFICIADLHSPLFLWRNEWFIKELFEALCAKKFIEKRHDPMTRSNEVIRNVSSVCESVLYYNEYIKLITICEEAFTECKEFIKQIMFSGAGTNSHNILAGLPRSIADFNLEEVRLFEEKLEQYELGFDVPFRKIKTRRMKTIRGALQDKTDTQKTETNQHIQTFLHQTSLVAQLTDRLFK